MCLIFAVLDRCVSHSSGPIREGPSTLFEGGAEARRGSGSGSVLRTLPGFEILGELPDQSGSQRDLWLFERRVRPFNVVGSKSSRSQPRTLGAALPTTDEPFAAVILCTADRQQVDKRTRSKWSRARRYAAEYKTSAEPLATFVRRKGGLNELRSDLPDVLGGAVAVQRVDGLALPRDSSLLRRADGRPPPIPGATLSRLSDSRPHHTAGPDIATGDFSRCFRAAALILTLSVQTLFRALAVQSA